MLEHAIKVMEKVFEEPIQKKVEIFKLQMDFMPGKGTVNAVFAVKQMIETYEKVRKELYFVFVNLEKTFNHFPRNRKVICWAFRKKDILEQRNESINGDVKRRINFGVKGCYTSFIIPISTLSTYS